MLQPYFFSYIKPLLHSSPMHCSRSQAVVQKVGVDVVLAVVSAGRNYIRICVPHLCRRFRNHFRIRYCSSKVTIKSKYSSYKKHSFLSHY